ncbi:serine-aspartate repeat-containing protein F isoform X2 [Bactrocera dorsalis]|uniref:Serine-aspartate repeat-containing protein F isoform X2 n=1 Tax=Bactrocera dorsalis TaxID=27457 RepID=A0ABM3JKL5_BACDO|nr:serine-aspartate repeat-containing protein F isoform X2 [Bactrocera dorsalis]
MSGDVQPRKRKDKKKKRDGFDRKSEGELSFSRHSSFEEDESSHGVHITKMGSEDVHFHVQHEHGTGGHWCAKIFFFSLLAILFGLVGLIILENRGISDLDTPLSESRFSNYFDGWVDESRQEHDDHDPVQASIEEHDEHDEPFEEEEDHSELDEDADEEHDDEDDDEHDAEEEDATTEQTKEEEEDEDNDEKDEDNDNDDEDDEENATAEATVEQSNEEEEDNDDDNDVANDNKDEEEDEDDDEDENVTPEATKEEEEDDEADDNDEDNEDEKTAEVSQEANDDDKDDNDNEDDENDSKANAADEDDDDDDADNDDDDNSVEPIYERSTQQTSQRSTGNSAAAADDDDDAFDEEDDDDEANDSVENVVDNDAEELLLLQQKARQQAAEAAKNAPNSAEKDDKDDSAEAVPSWASSLAVKIGVGVALALVARLVLIRNNPNTIEEPAPEVIMKRRLTIASEADTYDNDEEEPPLLDDGEYSEEEIEIEEEYEYEEDEEIELPEDPDDNLSALAGEYIPETFEQLNNLYRSRLSEAESAHTSATPARVEEVRDQRFVAKKSPAVFTAPPPPPTTTTDKSFKKVSPFTTPATTTRTAQTFTPSLGQTQSPTTTASTKDETIKPKQNFNTTITKTTTAADLYSPKSNTKQYIPDSPKTTKHDVTHDLDYQPDEEDIDYDDDDGGVDDDGVGVGGAYRRDILDDTDEEDEEEEEDEDEEDIDDDLLDDDDISDVDDTELMNRLEAKYGRLPAKEYESDEDPDDPTWTQIKPKEELGGGPQAQNDDFDSFEHELRRANEDLMRENYALADKRFAELVQRFPDRPAAFLGQARLLDKMSEQQRSNNLLNQAIQAYKRYLAFGDDITDHAQFRKAAERCIERMRFMGHHMQAVPIHQLLIARFTNKPDVRNELAITYLLQNRLSDAKLVLQEVLRRWPKDGFAQVHYGFVLRQLDKDYENAVIYLRAGINSKAPGTQDGRFYFNLGDSLQRLGRQAEAIKVYKRAAALQLFPSIYQRSLYNEPDLRAQPYWTKAETTYAEYLNKLELNWQAIRDEALSLLSRRGNYLDEAESLRDTGNWQQYELYSRGQRRVKNCQKAPITCGLIEKFTAAAGCRRGQVKFSIMQPGTHVHAHCGPTNCRLRAHLGLVVPKGPRLRVAEEERTWKEGEFLIFDDSFEHEVWHNGTSLRLVLIVDVWHPDLSAMKRRTLSAI